MKLLGFNDSNSKRFKELLQTKHNTKHNIYISYSAQCGVLKVDGIKSPMTHRRFKTRRRRKQMSQAGSLVQTDASSHDCLEQERVMHDLELRLLAKW